MCFATEGYINGNEVGYRHKEAPHQEMRGLSCNELAATYSPTLRGAVPSAQWGLTTLFGKGRGRTPTL